MPKHGPNTGPDSGALWDDHGWSCHLLHIDMDAFYASVMIRNRPDLQRLPVIVGGGDRGVVLAANYVARRYGVSSGMPSTRARRRCPDAVVLKPDYRLFESVSSSVMELFASYTPVLEAVSMDEAFLDVGTTARSHGSPRQIAEEIRARVFDEQRITCSVGIAASVAVAKLASRGAKPDGTVVVPPERVTSFLHPLDVGQLWGVGEKTRDALYRLGLKRVGDVAHTPLPVLQRGLGNAMGRQLLDLAWGTDRGHLNPRRPEHEAEKSMGADETFSRDTDDPDVVLGELLRLSAKVGARLRSAGAAGRTVTIRVRFADFTTITRSHTMSEATDVTSQIYAQARALFHKLGLQRARIRLVGVRVEGLMPRGQVHHQLVLGAREHGWAEADRAVDRAALRFGNGAVQLATLVAAGSQLQAP